LRIVVASGKGGTGKTTVATSLALSLAGGAGSSEAHHPPVFVDCDVEGPNAHLFLEPALDRRSDIAICVPRVDDAQCSACGECAVVCQYHAIVALGKRTLVFDQLCHGCGSCALVCPTGAIREASHVIGVLEAGAAKSGTLFFRGVLNVGEPMAAPAIRQLKRWANAPAGATLILDAPPGAACPVVETARGADFALLVTEPTPFGLHDLGLAAGVARALGIPAGVVINRDGIGDEGLDAFCASAGLPILLRIPFDRAVAEGIARGKTLVEVRPELAPQFRALFREIELRAA
jgi:MinD superfamily P-loop ATPase